VQVGRLAVVPGALLDKGDAAARPVQAAGRLGEHPVQQRPDVGLLGEVLGK
jgi:hypothetical protein